MKAVRFAIVGSFVALIYVLSYVALVALGLAQPFANAIAFFVAIALQYIGQASFTFGKRINDPKQMIRFFSMTTLGFITAASITGILGPLVAAPHWAAAFAVTIILPIQNYIIMTAWVFSQDSKINEATL
jgi:putative flippase GtrA